MAFVLKLALETTDSDKIILNKRFYIAEHISNVLIKHSVSLLNKLKFDKEYQDCLKQYVSTKDVVLKKQLSKQLTTIRKNYGLSEYQLHSYAKQQQHMYKKNIDAFTTQKIATRIWQGVEKVLFSDGRSLHYKKYGTLKSLEGKSNSTGIRFKDNCLYWNGLKIPVVINKKDFYAKQALDMKVIKLCKIKREPFNNGYHYYVQLTIDGLPPLKHFMGNGDIGIDIGTSTIAFVSKDHASLKELAPDIKKYNDKIIKYQKYLERSQKQNNPNNYNNNGTIKKGKLKWVRSNNYVKTLFKLKNAYRKRNAYVVHEHNKLANQIISLGNNIYVEEMNFKALQKKAKETKRQDKLSNIKGKQIHKFKKKKRFGKSLNNKAPAMLITIIHRKLGYFDNHIYKVNTKTFKASQYNHISDTYTKKLLSERWNCINEFQVQRDLYSAFLLMNAKETLDSTDRNKCIKTFSSFMEAHNTCINEIINNKIKYPFSFGL